jgi:hypothetical protein
MRPGMYAPGQWAHSQYFFVGPSDRIHSSPEMGPYGVSRTLRNIVIWVLPTTTVIFCYMGSSGSIKCTACQEQLPADVRTENSLPSGLREMSDIMRNHINASRRGRGSRVSAAARLQHFLDEPGRAQMLRQYPTRSMLVSGLYAASRSSRNSRCACACAGRVTEEAPGTRGHDR